MSMCIWCGKKLFTSARKDTIYCSGACKVAAHRSGIPTPMLKTARWINWDSNKRPINPANGNAASSTNPETWTSHAEARNASKRIGFVLGQGIGCIDLDHCITANKALTPAAQELVEYYPDNWIEISPSGDGLHIWGTAPEMKGIRREWHGQQIEFYTTWRYITVTGRTWQKGSLQPL